MKKSTLLVLSFCLLAMSSYSQALKTNKKYYKPGEQISVSFTAPSGYNNTAWIGLIPSNVPHGQESVNDQNDIAYQYLEGKTSGTFVFSTNNQGNFDLRMNDNDGGGREVASASVIITNNIPSSVTSGASSSAQLSIQKNHFQQNEEIVVSFIAPAGINETAWIGIIPSNIKHGEEGVNDQNDVSYQYLNKKTSGTLTFKAPQKNGSWDLRMNSDDSGGKELTSVSFSVGDAQSSNISNTAIISGVYNSDWGEMTLTQNGNKVAGTYNNEIGRIEGTLNDHTLTGMWYQGVLKGKIIFEFNSNFSGFKGKYGHDKIVPSGKWDGTKVN